MKSAGARKGFEDQRLDVLARCDAGFGPRWATSDDVMTQSRAASLNLCDASCLTLHTRIDRQSVKKSGVVTAKRSGDLLDQ